MFIFAWQIDSNNWNKFKYKNIYARIMKTPLSLAEISPNDLQTNKIFTTIFQKLRGLKTQEEILQAGVEIIYRVLQCDRAVVYSLQGDSYCKILAEAVTPGYEETLGLTIKDVCFESGYLEKYRKGRVRAIDNIYESGLKSCHIESLEQIDVKSNLVVPVVFQDRSLYGLLVMHQCAETRRWQQSEIEFALQIASWLSDRLEQQQTHAELVRKLDSKQQVNQLLASVAKQIHGAKTVKEVLQLGVDRARELLNCDRVIVYGLQNGNMGKIVAEAKLPALASILGSKIIDPCFEYRYRERYQQGRIRSIPNIFEAGMTDCYVENLAKIGVKSNLVAPINWDNGEIYGLLVAHQCFSFQDWQDEEIEYFQHIAFHTGLSLSKSVIKEQSQAIELRIEQLSQIKRTVNLAKAQLKESEQPIRQIDKILIEMSNLNHLLEREMVQIHQNSSAQTRKDTKLIQIITKKLVATTLKLKSSFKTFDTNSERADIILTEAIAQINGDSTL